MVMTLIMLISDAIFSIPAVNDWFSGLITKSNPAVVYLIIWLIMFLQVTILNVPAYTILSACVSIGIKTLSWEYILTVLSAYLTGCLLAYLLGYKFGKKAVKWCAGSEEDYNKWCEILNTKGKWWYFMTVLFPFFPDDLLCLVAGAVKLNIWFYTISNVIGRGVGLVTMLLFLKLVGLSSYDFPIMLIVWALALYAEIVAYFIYKRKGDKDEKSDDDWE